jgi:signal peptidase II
MQEEARASLTSPTDPHTGPAAAPAVGRSRLSAIVLLWTVLTFVADQGTKIWALKALEPGQPRPLIGDWIQLNLIRNSGAAFSLGNTMTWLLTLLSIAIIVGVVVTARRVATWAWAVTLGLLLGGALGNLLDRMVREPAFFRGHVVDFIDYFGWFIGNVADIAIVVAAGLVILLTLRGIPATNQASTSHAPRAQTGSTDE